MDDLGAANFHDYAYDEANQTRLEAKANFQPASDREFEILTYGAGKLDLSCIYLLAAKNGNDTLLNYFYRLRVEEIHSGWTMKYDDDYTLKYWQALHKKYPTPGAYDLMEGSLHPLAIEYYVILMLEMGKYKESEEFCQFFLTGPFVIDSLINDGNYEGCEYALHNFDAIEYVDLEQFELLQPEIDKVLQLVKNYYQKFVPEGHKYDKYIFEDPIDTPVTIRNVLFPIERKIDDLIAEINLFDKFNQSSELPGIAGILSRQTQAVTLSYSHRELGKSIQEYDALAETFNVPSYQVYHFENYQFYENFLSSGQRERLEKRMSRKNL